MRRRSRQPRTRRRATPHDGLADTILRSCNVCSKEWIIRQYDHEVQGGSVIKPLVGIHDDGPGDAAVVMPVLGSCARAGHRLRHQSALWRRRSLRDGGLAIDEAMRNVSPSAPIPSRIALLDNFCWGNTDGPRCSARWCGPRRHAGTSPWHS